MMIIIVLTTWLVVYNVMADLSTIEMGSWSNQPKKTGM